MKFLSKIIYTLSSPELLHKHRVEAYRRLLQNILIWLKYNKKAYNLIVFLVPPIEFKTGKENLSGGLLSIDSIYRESKNVFDGDINNQVIITTFPNSYLAIRFNWFKSDSLIFRFNQLAKFFQIENKLIIHVPELLTKDFLIYLKNNNSIAKKASVLHINILNQNIKLMPSPEIINELKLHCNTLTQTTAHQKYCSTKFRLHYNIPVHHFSVFASKYQYDYVSFEKRENIIAFSKDPHPEKENVLKILKHAFDKSFSFIEIKDYKYEKYRELIKKVKFTITFGEGLDFYFIETAFSGGVGISVYNEDFFPKNFNNTLGVFDSYDHLKAEIVNFIVNRSKSNAYKLVNIDQCIACENIYNYDQYKSNIRNFYSDNYTLK